MPAASHPDHHRHDRPASLSVSLSIATIACLLLAACGSSGSGTGSSTTAGGASPKSTGPASSPTTVGAAAPLPGSCSGIPVTLIGPDIGGVATTHSMGKPPQLSCEFANAAATSIVVVNLGVGSTAQFAALKAASGGGGRTITPISGLGASAFSISKGGVPRGIDAISAQNLVVSVGANLPVDKTEAIVQQLISLH